MEKQIEEQLSGFEAQLDNPPQDPVPRLKWVAEKSAMLVSLLCCLTIDQTNNVTQDKFYKLFDRLTVQFKVAAPLQLRAANLRSKLLAIEEATEGVADGTNVGILLQGQQGQWDKLNNAAEQPFTAHTAVNTHRQPGVVMYGEIDFLQKDFRAMFKGFECIRCKGFKESCYVVADDKAVAEVQKMGYGCKSCYKQGVRCSIAFNPATQDFYPRDDIRRDVALELQMVAEGKRREEITGAAADKRRREDIDRAVAGKKPEEVTGAAPQRKKASTSSLADTLRAHVESSRLSRKEVSRQFDGLKHSMDKQSLKSKEFINEWQSKVVGEGGYEDFEEVHEDEDE